jgi:peptide/nickel transport system substrate-binding protein
MGGSLVIGRTRGAVVAAAAIALLAGACSSDSKSDSAGTTAAAGATTSAPGAGATTTAAGATTTAGNFAKGGTFTVGFPADPGVLNPLNNTSTQGNWIYRFLYDSLVNRTPTGDIAPGIASSWTFDGSVATFTIRKDVTCADGSPVTPTVIAKAFDWVKNPDNAARIVGAVVPNRNYTVTADDAASTVTVKLDQPFSLLLSSLSFLFIPCGPAADNPAGLTTTSSGSGPYVLSKVTPNDSYEMTKRPGYTWGYPAGSSTSDAGLPDKIVVRIINSEATAANLLLGGQLNASVINGTDFDRLDAAGAKATSAVSGGVVMMFNETPGKPTSDPAVRKALAMALDRGQVASVVTQRQVTEPGTSVSAAQPQVCDDKSAASAIPKQDVEGAKKLLQDAGWVPGSDGIRTKAGARLTLNTIYSTALGGMAPATELVAAAWKEIGVEATITPITQAVLNQILFQTGDYDVSPLTQFNNPFPSTLVGLMGGPFPPDGVNASHVDNAAYKAAFATALTTPGDAGCQAWVTASEALFSSADMVPISDFPIRWVLKGAQMDTLGGRIIPLSIRMLAS